MDCPGLATCDGIFRRSRNEYVSSFSVCLRVYSSIYSKLLFMPQSMFLGGFSETLVK